MSTPSTITLLIRNALRSAGMVAARVSTKLVNDDMVFETTVTGVIPRNAAMVLRGYHGNAYGTSVTIRGNAVISRQLNK